MIVLVSPLLLALLALLREAAGVPLRVRVQSPTMKLPSSVAAVVPEAVRDLPVTEANWKAVLSCFPTEEAAANAVKLNNAILLPYGFDASNRAANIAGSYKVLRELLQDEGDEGSIGVQRSSTKVGAILELASVSASSLLNRWPAAQDELLWLLNTELPTALRHSMWHLKLRAPAARAEYERKRSESLFATLSLRDGAISQGCQATLQRIAPQLLSQLNFHKTCLSYADSLRPLPPAPSGWPSTILDASSGAAPAAATGGDGARDGAKGGGGGAKGSAGAIHTAPLESFWGVPLLRVFVGSANATRSAAEQAELEAALIEHFIALVAMPKPLLGLAADKKGGKADKKGKAALGPSSAEALLGTVDEELASKLVGMLGITGIDAILLPYAQRLAVGFFGLPLMVSDCV